MGVCREVCREVCKRVGLAGVQSCVTSELCTFAVNGGKFKILVGTISG